MQVFHLEQLRVWPECRDVELSKSYDDIVRSGKTPLIIDCGANCGFSSAYLALKYPAAGIVAVEPEADIVAALKRNTAGHKVDVVQGAIASAAKNISLVNASADSNSFQTREDSQGGIRAYSVDDLLSRHDRATHVPLMMKIDIEGFEDDLFASNTEWIDQFPVITIELHDWMLPGQCNSKNFLKAIAGRNRDFIFYHEHVYSIRVDAAA